MEVAGVNDAPDVSSLPDASPEFEHAESGSTAQQINAVRSALGTRAWVLVRAAVIGDDYSPAKPCRSCGCGKKLPGCGANVGKVQPLVDSIGCSVRNAELDDEF